MNASTRRYACCAASFLALAAIAPALASPPPLPHDFTLVRPGVVRMIDHGALHQAAQHRPAPDALAAQCPLALGAERLTLSPRFPSTNTIKTVAIFQDVNPWGSSRNQQICISNGIALTILGTNDMGVADLSLYDKVIIASVQSSNFYAQLSHHSSWFWQYAYLGGLLEMHLASVGNENTVDGLWLPGGFLAARYVTNAVEIAATNFPMLHHPHTITHAMLQGWGSSTHGYFFYRPWGSQPIVFIGGTNLPCAVDYPVGAGRIFATLQPVEYITAPWQYAENMLLYAGYDNVAILQDWPPWGSVRAEGILASNLIAYTIFGSNELGMIDLSPFDKVIVSGSQPSNFYARLNESRTWLEAYAAQGGLLDLHLAANSQEYVTPWQYPGGFVVAQYFAAAVTIVDTNASVVTYPHLISNAMINGWSFPAHGFFAAAPQGAHTIIACGDNAQPCAMRVRYGAGRIFATAQPLEFFLSARDYHENTILDTMRDFPPPPLNVLVYADDWRHVPPHTHLDRALRSLNLPYTPFYAGRFDLFTHALTNGGPWDVVLFANDNNFATSNVYDALLAYVQGGGKLAGQSWTMSSHTNHPLFAALGCTFVTNVTGATRPVYWLNPAHSLFTQPFTVPMLAQPDLHSAMIYGQHCTTTNGGHAVAAFNVSPAVSNAYSIIIGASGDTIWRTFLDASFSQDLNVNGRPDAEELWVNIINYLEIPEPGGVLLAALALCAWRRRARRV